MGGVESKCTGEKGGGSEIVSTFSGIRSVVNGSNGVTCGAPTSAGLHKTKLPMPDHAEVESRFAKILVSDCH